MVVIVKIINSLADQLRFGLVNMVDLELVVGRLMLICIGRIYCKAEANVKTFKIGSTWLRALLLVYMLIELWFFELIKVAIEHVLRLLPSSLLRLIFPLTLKHIFKGFCLSVVDILAFFAVHLRQISYLCMNTLSTVNQLLQSFTIFLFEEIRYFLYFPLCDFAHLLLQVFLMRKH